MFAMAASPFRAGYGVVCDAASHWKPENPIAYIASAIAGIWAYQIAATYAPGKIAHIVGFYTFTKMGEGAFAYYYAYFVVAPAVVPSLTPMVACCAAFSAALTVTILTNKIIFWYNK